MFILKRKSDDKFWTDDPPHKYVRFGHNFTRVLLEQWTENLIEAKVFKTKSGVMSSRGVIFDWKYEQCPIHYLYGPEYTQEERTARAEEIKIWHRDRNKMRLKLIHDNYEAVEVEMRVKVDEVKV